MTKLKDIVQFRGDRLFNGAVNVDWLWTDERRSREASEAFIFHGPAYHGVTQADVGTLHGHRLQDTASFVLSIVRRCLSFEEQPFTLAIAGYGTGKSHLALTLATLLRNPSGTEAEGILTRLCSADASIGSEIRALFQEDGRPSLIIAFNGMQSFDLVAAMTKQVLAQVQMQSLDTRPLDELRPRFSQAANLIRMSSASIVEDLLQACGSEEASALLHALDVHDEEAYACVHDFFASKGMPIRALGGESVKDLIDVIVREYCGVGKAFGRLVVLFDEFGRFTEFATVRSQVAGSGVLQDLFEGIQSNSDCVTFAGFIQFELNAYVQRVAGEFKNEILRYVTRYQTAAKAYLSINLETLIANLLEKRAPKLLDEWFDNDDQRRASGSLLENINDWFPQSQGHRLWSSPEQFHSVIRKGCWPLSPLSSWLLFYLTAAGKHLQERSALALLTDVFERHGEVKIPADGSWLLFPVDLWSDALQQELLASEETAQQGSITHAYASVIARHRAQLDDNLVRVLRGIVLCSKLGLRSESKEDAIESISHFMGQPHSLARELVDQLHDEYNVIQWDQSFKQFDILGDAVPRTQFLAFLRQRVASSFDENTKANLFASRGQEWCDLLGDLVCDFAEENQISTREWNYLAVTSTHEMLETNLKFALARWNSALGVDQPRGTVIFCYVQQSRDADAAATDGRRLLRTVGREAGAAVFPVFIVLLCDEEGLLGQAMAELSVLEEGLTEEEKSKFGNLVGAHIEKAKETVRVQVESMIRARRYVTAINEAFEARRLSRFGSELFAHIYKKPIPFPFDGFSTARGNAADTCQQLTVELLLGSLDYDSVMAKPPKVKNRAVTVLQGCWDVFNKTGSISRRPNNRVIRSFTEKWDNLLQSGQNLSIADALRELCLPPHGANIASAGLVLGVFVAPRVENLVAVCDGEQLAISQWVKDAAFKGKFVDVERSRMVELALVGKASSEWENILEEWEQAESHFVRTRCLEQAQDLKERVPVPPVLRYRFNHLVEQAEDSLRALLALQEEENKAHAYIARGEENSDVSSLSRGGAALTKLIKRLHDEGSLWTQHEVEGLRTGIERSRQLLVRAFPEWLDRQIPNSDSPEAVGDFKHKMLRLIGGNLQDLELQHEYEALVIRVNDLVKNAESAAEARQLIRDVRSWMQQHADACRIVRMAALRGLREIGRDYSGRLQGMSRRVQIVELSELRSALSEFLERLQSAQAEIESRASRLLKAKLRPDANIDELADEVEQLVTVYEGCEADLEDFRLMRRALRYYQQAYNRLNDEGLCWPEFESLTGRLRKEAQQTLVDEGIPWDVDETFAAILESVEKRRKEASMSWIQELESAAGAVPSMSAADANRMHERVSSVPPYVTEPHAKRAGKLQKQIEIRLDALAVDWLLEKFKELPEKAKKVFLDKLNSLGGG